MNPIIKVTGLSKKFGSKQAVDHIDFEVNQGQVFGLLGPNGSGKTTTLSMILTLLEPTSGSVSIFGSDDITASLNRIGVLLESANYYPELSATDNMRISCKIKHVSPDKIDPLLKKVNLYDDRKRKVGSYSLGMKQRLAVAASLLNDPELLIFDEPTNGLDPIGIAEMRETIGDLAKEGKTILVASHLLSEMEKLCTHIAILKNGKVIEKGEMKTLIKDYPSLEDYFLKIAR